MPKPKWRTSMPVYRCDAGCGLCCRRLLVEADAVDVLREPRIQDVSPLRKMDRSLPVIDNCWILAGPGHPCPFLSEESRCGIYPTRPTTCVGFAAGGEKCRKLRAAAGMAPLEPAKADGSMDDRLRAELVGYESEEEYA